MRIIIDINHPAHVHYFKNFIKIMEKRAHHCFVISRNKEMEHSLLKKYNIPFHNRGKGSGSIPGKILYFFKAVFIIFKKSWEFKPDILISFGTPYPAIASKMIRRPHFSIYDTEHAKLHHWLTNPFSKLILTPDCFKKNLGKKQIFFKGYMELCYLHPVYFRPDSEVLKDLGVKKDEKFVILRFVSRKSSHDIGAKRISPEMKKLAIQEFSKYAKVFITSEHPLPEEFSRFQLKLSPEKIHDALYYAALLYGESATMASECAILGTPAIFIDKHGRGYTDEEEKKI